MRHRCGGACCGAARLGPRLLLSVSRLLSILLRLSLFTLPAAQVVLEGSDTSARFGAFSASELTPETAPLLTASAGSRIQCSLLCLGVPECKAANFLPGTSDDGGGGAGGSCELLSTQIGALTASAAPGAAVLWLPGTCNGLRLLGYRATDAVYRYRGLPVPLYCDMEYSDGGWTLLTASVSIEGWTIDNVLQRNTDTPGIDINYSILGLGDQIKSMGHGSVFRYRIEAGGPQRWGGIWEAPSHYSLLTSYSNQSATRIVTYDAWAPPTRETARDIVPWVNTRGWNSGKPLLTTASELDSTWWGTIVTAFGSWGVSPWIYAAHPLQANTPRLYWLKETIYP